MATLDFSKKQVIKVITPAGVEIILTPRRMTIEYSKIYREKLDKLSNQVDAGDITEEDQILKIMALLIEDFDKQIVKDFTISELTQIISEIREIAENPTRTEEEKKTV